MCIYLSRYPPKKEYIFMSLLFMINVGKWSSDTFTTVHWDPTPSLLMKRAELLVLSLMAGAPALVGVVMLGVGGVTAVSGGVGGLICPFLAPPPGRHLGRWPPRGGGGPAVHSSSLGHGERWRRLAPAGGAVELVLSQQSGTSSRRVELLQRNHDQQKEEKKTKKKTGQKECYRVSGRASNATVNQKKVNI